jgi:uncharacterized protein YaeQ
MALPSTIYRANIQLANLEADIYLPLQTTIARHPSETAERLLARLLAYAFFHQPELSFTKGIAAGDEPDLWTKEADGRVLAWIEVGLPDPERLIKAVRHSGRVILLAYGSNLSRWIEQHRSKLEFPNLSVVRLDHVFLGELAKGLQRSISWSLTITDGCIY